MRPNTFSFMTSGAYTGCLALLMFSMGITLTIDDFKRVFAKPRVIGLGFFACYALMPALAFAIGNALGLSGPLLGVDSRRFHQRWTSEQPVRVHRQG